jgi:cytochrome c oxidase subunit II
MHKLLGLPEVASVHGPGLDQVTIIVHALMAVMFIGWGALFLYMLVRFRRSRNPLANYHGARSRASSWAEWGVVGAEAVLLIGFSVPLWSERVDAFPDEDEALVVRLVAEQFAWTAHYAGADGVFGRTSPQRVDIGTNPLGLERDDPFGKDDVVSVNRLHLPVNRPVVVHLTSKDVIHSFMLNEMRVKQDTIPGLSIPVHFTPTVTTAEMRERLGKPDFDYEIACAQLCGIGHYRMRGFVTVHGQEEFDSWLAAESAKAAEEESDDFWG